LQPIAIRINQAGFRLLPAGCLHWPIGDKELLKAWVEELRTTPGAYGILMGDSLDVARTHYRNHIRSYRDDDNSQEALDAYVNEEVQKLAKILRPVAKRIWGVVRGNHMWEYLDGTNSEQALCRTLGIRYLGVMGLIRVTCVAMPASKVSHQSTRSLVVFAHHTGGSAGGRTTGGDVNGLTKQENAWDADIYLLGHTHRRIAFKEPVMTLTRDHEPKIIERNRVFARTGAFLKGFRQDGVPVNARHTPSYAEEKALRPTDLGWVRIDVKWRRKDAYSPAYPEYLLSY
jgi:hypothetical protein